VRVHDRERAASERLARETRLGAGSVSGGPVHGVGLGVLVGSLGLAGLQTGRLPRTLCKTALASSAAGALSPLALVGKAGLAFIPLGRLSALAVIGVSGVRLAR
jgi:hypothetical protein